MTTFSASNRSEADVPAPRADIWAIVASPDSLAELTPLVQHITANGDHWCWQPTSVKALGMSVEPSFTEHMSFEDGKRMTFAYEPPAGKLERAGAEGVYTLADRADGGTHLAVDITIQIDLPLPAISRRAVERVMGSMMARTGAKFAENLYTKLGIAVPPGSTTVRAGS